MEKKCSGFTLKMIAVVTMFIDHFGATIWERMMFRHSLLAESLSGEFMYNTYLVLRGIGRMAFPIYCFLLVEGFMHTRNCGKYLLRLFLFALISEIPFDLAFSETVFEWGYNNVFFTLLTGLLTIWGMEEVKKRLEVTKFSYLVWPLWFVLTFWGCVVSELVFHCDYGSCGVLAIFAIYILKEQPLLGFFSAVLILGLLSDSSEFLALLMLIPIYFYNGKRGPRVKYFFYVFYPAHLLLLSLACYGLGLGI